MTPRIVAISLLSLFLVTLGLSGQQPAKSREAVFKLFVEELIPVTPGKGKYPAKFTLGNPAKDAPETETPTVEVTLAKPFAISKYEVTQELYEAIMGKNPARWRGPRNSVEMCDVRECREFCQKLTGELRKAGLIEKTEEIRLPSEAEWEYCCKAGTTTKWSFGDNLEDLGTYSWFKTNSPGNDPPVGMKKPNPWGLYDMHGYVWEWVEDSWSPSHKANPKDGSPVRLKDTTQAVIRGGSFADPPDLVSSTARVGKLNTTRSDQIGFRCVKAAVAGGKE